MKLELSQQEQEDVIVGLQMRICVIETGNPSLRANDAIESGQPKLVRALSDEQKATVGRFEELVVKVRGNGNLLYTAGRRR
jgi:hypothetical protein